jgi:hypothetical protein
VAQQSAGQRLLGLGIGPDGCAGHRMRAALSEGHQTHLGKRRGPARRTRTAEPSIVVGRVGNIHRRAIDGHQPPVAIERSRRRLGGKRHTATVEQALERLGPEPLAGLKIADFDGIFHCLTHPE